MPVFEIETPDGTFEVDAPDERAALTALGVGQQPQSPQLQAGLAELSALTRNPAQIGVGEDMARSGAAGLRQGTEGLIGQFGDAAQMQGDIAGWAAGKFGASPETQETVSKWGSRLSPFGFAPTSGTLHKVTKEGIGESYQPKTVAGEYTRTAAQFAPGAVAGPGSLGRKVAMTVVPALASETAGQLTKGTKAEPYARAAAALVGGVASAGRAASTVKQAAQGAPTREALRDESNRLYTTMRNAGIRYDANEYANTVARMASDLRKKGFRSSTAGTAREVIRDLAGDIGRSPDFDDINGMISSIGGKARDLRAQGQHQEAAALDVIKDHLDDFESSAAMVSSKPLPRDQFDLLRQSARSTALKNIKARALEEIVANADTYQAGTEAGIRNGISNLLRSKRGIQLFKGAERKELLEVAQGRKALRTLSRFGFDLTKLSGNATLLPTLGILGAGMGLGPVAGAGLAAVGTAAKAASPYMTQRALDTASAAIRSGRMNSPMMMKAQKAQQLQALVRSLIAADSGENSAVSNSSVYQPNR